jgi:signal peptidase I
MLTFTAVNINRDQFGAIKADPLVKRITGVPGEKLMLVDGVLYHKTRDSSAWSVVAEDATWAAWNIDSLPMSQKSLVKSIPLSQEAFTQLESVESTCANLDLLAAKSECAELAKRFAALKPVPDVVTSPPELISAEGRELFALFRGVDTTTKLLLSTNGGAAWFHAFMTDWSSASSAAPARKNLYDDQSMRLNVLFKLNFGRLAVRYADVVTGRATEADYQADPAIRSTALEVDRIFRYMQNRDQRNFGEFPAGPDEYIPDDCFFMMGDNRFNSLDMRHSYSYRLVSIDPEDRYSVGYNSNLAPQYVSATRILGGANFRFWPLSRAGVPR